MKRTATGKILYSEHEIQSDFFSWIETLRGKYPSLNYFFAIPNGANKSVASRMKFKREGLRRGVPDVCCPLPSIDGKYIGLFIEFKAASGVLSVDQAVWIGALSLVEHRVAVCRSWIEAANIAIDHLNLPLEKIV